MSNNQQSPGSWRCWTVYPGERTTEAGRRTVLKYTEDCCEGEGQIFMPCSGAQQLTKGLQLQEGGFTLDPRKIFLPGDSSSSCKNFKIGQCKDS